MVLNVDTNTLETPYDDLQSLPNDVVRNFCLSICLHGMQVITYIRVTTNRMIN